MPDIAFRCPKCAHDLAAPDNLQGRDVPCPHCKTTVAVPTPDVSAICPQCKQRLLASAEMAGLTYACPACDADIKIPASGTSSPAARRRVTALFTALASRWCKPPAAAAPPAPTAPAPRVPDAPSFRRGSIPMRPLPTPGSARPAATPELAPTPRQKPVLRLQPTSRTHESRTLPLPLVNTRSPMHDAATHRRRRRSIVVALVVLLGAGLVLALPDFDSKQVDAAWTEASAALDQVGPPPEDTAALGTLSSVIRGLAEAGVADPDRVGLNYALGAAYLLCGRPAEGNAIISRLQTTYPRSSFTRIWSAETAQSPCATCAGSGKALCARCKVPGKCNFCKGTGHPPSLSGAKVIRTSRNPRTTEELGGRQAIDAAPARRETKCPACDGTGNCTACKGTQRGAEPCRTCNGSGALLDPRRIAGAFTSICEAAHRDAAQHLNRIRLRATLRSMQQALRRLVGLSARPPVQPAPSPAPDAT